MCNNSKAALTCLQISKAAAARAVIFQRRVESSEMVVCVCVCVSAWQKRCEK